MSFDVDRIRSEYPALHEGFAHFDGAAGTLVAARASAAITEVIRGAVANKSTAFEPGRRALRIAATARAAVADLVGGEAAGVVFGPSATALTYLVARTLAQDWGPGDEVVVSRLDHDANVRPWVQAAARCGATVRWADFDLATGALPTGQYRELVTDRTRVVAVTAASNAIGTRPDIPAITAIAHEAGALTYVDAVHATPHTPTDVTTLGADFFVTSAYKWSGPHVAACVAAPSTWEGLRPDKLLPAPDSVPERFEFGTLSFELLAGVTGAVEHLAGLDGSTASGPPGEFGSVSAPAGERRARILRSMTLAQEYELSLLAMLVDGLSAIDGVTMCAAPAHRCPTVAFRVGDQHPGRTAEILGEAGVCVFSGDYYAAEYFQAAGLRESGGAVRASIYHYTTEAEIDRMLDVVRRCR